MTKILVTGSKGQLGSELQKLAGNYPGYRFLFTDIDELDITDASAVRCFFESERPEVVINCAAYTAVDQAEDHEDTARLLNAEAAGSLAAASGACDALMVHISTDYVFSGNAERPMTEEDDPDPVSVYGRTKLEGEKAVAANATRAVIIRTSWLYSSFGNNFVKTILRYGRERGTLNVVDDQTGTPTYARDLAEAILNLLPEMRDIRRAEIFNYSNEGITTWYDFALEIIAVKGIRCTVNPILTKEYPTRAPRPAYSVLSKEKIKQRFGITIQDWRVSLKECLKKID